MRGVLGKAVKSMPIARCAAMKRYFKHNTLIVRPINENESSLQTICESD
jgi:hypothetical protein